MISWHKPGQKVVCIQGSRHLVVGLVYTIRELVTERTNCVCFRLEEHHEEACWLMAHDGPIFAERCYSWWRFRPATDQENADRGEGGRVTKLAQADVVAMSAAADEIEDAIGELGLDIQMGALAVFFAVNIMPFKDEPEKNLLVFCELARSMHAVGGKY